MSVFPKVATLQIRDNVYDIKDNLDKAKYDIERQKTLESDNILLLNKALLAEAITNKGITTEPSDSLMQMAENIQELNLGDRPAKGILTAITAFNIDVALSAAYNYPWTSRTYKGATHTNYSQGSAGYEYELLNGNPDLKDTVVITRLRNNIELADDIPVLFFNSIFPIHTVLIQSDLHFRINGGSDIVVPFPTTETFTIADFYIKYEIKKQSGNIYTVTISLSEPDIDGNITDFDVLHIETLEVTNKSTDLYLSMLGAAVKWYVADVLVTDDINSSNAYGDNGLLQARYENYIRETCLVVKDDNDIYKVVLGSSSEYPMN